MFVAVTPPGGVLDAVESAVEVVRTKVTGARFTDRSQWHLTLQFLGNRADPDAVAAALRDLAVVPGRVRLGGGGAFPSARRARVVWLGVVEGAEFLAQLAAAAGALLAPLGHEPEGRAYRPHLTLARLREPSDVRAAVEALGTEALGTSAVGEEWMASDVTVVESRLRREGAQYVERARIRLAGRGPV